ncbi:BtrH N-terminal domain-containing protein [Streptomyces tremellae]|uniref:Butirosin biosynthesis protein H N-terminal domain-containing protein n=1 Tax=Streptomyces tremellae TaxID=1124239 RepID=A0ABP7ES61_9ACTN
MTAPVAERAEWSVDWYDDLCSCLQIDIGHVLERAGWDPVRALGAGWRFRAPAGPVEPVEYYHPAGDALEDLLCLHHPVRLRWHRPAGPADAHRELVASLARGVPVVAAVNNFHLPFRPAYHDVHAAHLLVVTGHDAESDTYDVTDPMPPAFRGPLPRGVLEEARGSISVEDASDPFFAGSSPAWRWLEVRPTGPQPPLTWPWLREVVHGNTIALRAPGHGPSALTALLRALPDRVAEQGPGVLREVYVLGWPAQAEAALHAGFLTRAARALRRPELAEAGRWVDRVAHGWTGLRMAAAHGTVDRLPDPRHLLARGENLVLAWEHCLTHLERLAGGPR